MTTYTFTRRGHTVPTRYNVTRDGQTLGSIQAIHRGQGTRRSANTYTAMPTGRLPLTDWESVTLGCTPYGISPAGFASYDSRRAAAIALDRFARRNA